MSARTLSAVVLSAALALAASSAKAEPLAPGEAALDGRLIAPCCWNQTLDIHESEIASSLRAEVHARLVAGESSTAIEDDLARRFGERIRAVPRGRDARGDLSIGLGIAGLLAAGVLVQMVRGWARRMPPPLVPASTAVVNTEEDERLDEELRALDD